MCACVLSCFSHVRLFATLGTLAHQAPLSMGFSRQEYWSGLPCLSSVGNYLIYQTTPLIYHCTFKQLG